MAPDYTDYSTFPTCFRCGIRLVPTFNDKLLCATCAFKAETAREDAREVRRRMYELGEPEWKSRAKYLSQLKVEDTEKDTEKESETNMTILQLCAAGLLVLGTLAGIIGAANEDIDRTPTAEVRVESFEGKQLLTSEDTICIVDEDQLQTNRCWEVSERTLSLE